MGKKVKLKRIRKRKGERRGPDRRFIFPNTKDLDVSPHSLTFPPSSPFHFQFFF